MIRRRLVIWLQLQRERIAHAVYPHAWPDDWTCRTVAEAIEDDDLRRRMEAQSAREAALRARRMEFTIHCPDERPAPDAAKQFAREIERRGLG